MTQADDAMSADEKCRKRLAFRCWHRGMREMDLLLGRFADARIAGMSTRKLAELEMLLDIPDTDLFAWISGVRTPAPVNVSSLIAAIRDFHAGTPTVQDADRL
jgi:antitoxin CptB